MFNKHTLFSLVIFTITFNTFAIDETESIRKRSQDKPNFTNLSIDLSGKKGNSETENIALGIYHSERLNQHFAYIMASREYSNSNGQKSADNSFFHVRYNYYLTAQNSVELFAQANVDDFRSLESRKLLGVAYRQEINSTTALGLGLFNEQEEYLVNGQTQSFDQNRFNVYWVTTKDLNPYVSFSNTLYYQPNIEEIEDFRVFNKLGINSKITDNISMKFGLLVEHDSRPVLNVEASDISYQAGFEIEF